MNWLNSIEFSSEYGRRSLDLLIENYIYLKNQQLKVNKDLRNLSKSEAFSESFKLISSVK